MPLAITNSAFIPSANVLAATNKPRRMLFFMQRSFTCLRNEIFAPLYCALVWPHLKYVIQENCSYLKKDINHLERIRTAATRWVKGLRGLTYDETTAPRKKKAKKWFGSQNTLQLYRCGSNTIVQILPQARTKKIIKKTPSSNRENPQNRKQFCVQGCW